MPLLVIIVVGVISLLISIYVPWYLGVAALLAGLWLVSEVGQSVTVRLPLRPGLGAAAGAGMITLGAIVIAAHLVAGFLNMDNGRGCDLEINRSGPSSPC